MNFTILAERISTLIRDNVPYALRPTCIAGKLNVAEGEIRNIEEALVSRVGFAITRRPCDGCGNIGDHLGFKLETARKESRESAMDLESVRVLIQRRLADGLLPRAPMPRVWGGIGTAATCAAYEETLSKHQFSIEGTDEGKTMIFHVRCFYLWDQERQVTG
jgi:hypothetical protein